MNKTRIFISSTCYDLSQIRRDLEAFIESIGHEPVLSDSRTVSIPPGLDPVEGCKWLVQSSDIFVLIVGGRFGTTVPGTEKSITNIELDVAIKYNLPIYVFVDAEVWIKRPIYEQFKTMASTGDIPNDKLKTVLGGKIEDVRVFDFIQNISKTEGGQWIYQFSEAADVIGRLKECLSLLLKEQLSLRREQGWKPRPQTTLPKLSLYFLYNEEKHNDTLSIAVPNLLDKDALYSDLEGRKVDPATLAIFKDRAKELKNLIKVCDPKEIGLSFDPIDIDKFIHSPKEFNNSIDKLVVQLKGNFEEFRYRYYLSETAIKPNFVVLNDGSCPAENIVIYVYPSDEIQFMPTKDIDALALRLPTVSSELIHLAKTLDEKLLEFKAKLTGPQKAPSTSPWAPFLSSPSSFPNLLTPSPHLPTTKPEVEVEIEKLSIRININRKLKHNFQNFIINEDIYLVHKLNKGETASLRFVCFADNLPFPNRGKLIVNAV